MRSIVGHAPPKRALIAMARAAAERHGLPEEWFLAQIQNESSFDPHAVSHKGAQGIAQIMPNTAKGWGVNPWDPAAALDAAAKAMAGYWRTYQRQGHTPRDAYKRALVAYNCGPSCDNPNNAETRAYVAAIMQ